MSDSDDLEFKDEVEEDNIEAPILVRKTEAEQSTIFYDIYDKSYAEQIESCDYTILGQIGKEPVKDAIAKLLDEFDHTPLNELIQKPSPRIVEFRKLITSKLNTKLITLLTTAWPPMISKNSPSIEPIIFLLVRMIHESADPERFLSWIASGLFDQNWYQKDTRSRLIAASPIKTPDRSLKWAVLDEDQKFYIFAQTSKGKLKPVYMNKASRTKLSADKKSIIVHGSVGEVIFQFAPKPSTLLEPWSKVFTKKRPPIWKFLLAKVDDFPTSVMFGIYKHFAQMDLHIVRALSMPGLIKGEHLIKVYTSILINASYTQKMPLFLHGILGAIFENPDSTVDGLAHKTLNLTSLFTTMALLFGGDYTKVFGRKLVNYACSVKIDLVRDYKKYTTLVFTCIKYICSSASLLPPQLRLLISMTHEYICIRNNSERAVRRILGAAIGTGIISAILSSPTDFGIEMPRYPDTGRHVAKALIGMFSKSPLPPKYNFEDWEQRISAHAEPQIASFIDECCKLDDRCDFEVPQLQDIAVSLRVLYETVSDYNEAINNQLELMENGAFFTVPAGWALAEALSGFFERVHEGHFRPACQLPSMLSLAPLLFPDKPASRAIATLVDHPLVAARPPAPEMFELQGIQDDDSETSTTVTDLYKPIIPKNVFVRSGNKLIDTEVSSSDDESGSYTPRPQKRLPMPREENSVKFAPMNSSSNSDNRSSQILSKIENSDDQNSGEPSDKLEKEQDEVSHSSNEEKNSTKSVSVVEAEKEEMSQNSEVVVQEISEQEASSTTNETKLESLSENTAVVSTEDSIKVETKAPQSEAKPEQEPKSENEQNSASEKEATNMPPPEDDHKEDAEEKESSDSDLSDISSLTDISSTLSLSESVSKKADVK